MRPSALARTPGWPTALRIRLRLALAVALAGLSPLAAALPGFDEVRAAHRPSETVLLDRHGEALHRLRTDATVRRGPWLSLAEISPALRHAMVLSEDRRFYEHSGVDWRAVSAAAWGNLWNTRTRGASTITMQLAGLLDSDWRAGPGGRSVPQKLGQAMAAQVLERRWRKDQILEAWLNLVPLRGEIVGIDAVARTLFGKAAHGLDTREAAVVAALVRGPNARPAVVTQRACGVLRQTEGPRADCAALDLFTTAALQRKAWDSDEGLAPHLARRLARQQPGQAAIASSLHAPLQRFAVETLQRHLRELRGRQVEDGAVLVLDNASGEVLAWVGSSGELSAAAQVDGVTAARQAGSTLKPFLYAQAIAERRLTAASLIEDSPAHIPTVSGLYIPQNYDRQFKGWVSARTALGASLNVPAVRTIGLVTPDAFHRQLRRLGLPLRESGDYHGHSLALGSAEVTLLALTNAYRALANGGRPGEVSLVRRTGAAAPAAPAIDPRAAFIVGDILADNQARSRTFGTDSVLVTRSWTAVKTGTSKDMRDNWAVGWSDRYTVGVWVGNASGAPMWNVSGTSGAAPVWAALMAHLHAGSPSRGPRPPEGVVPVATRFADGIEAARTEWFLRGTEQAWVALDGPGRDAPSAQRARAAAPADRSPDGASARITAPAPGTIVALDPDIPPQRQRLHFSASHPSARWRLDGKPLGQGERVAWLPWPGRHVVQLVDARGQVVDEIRIEVRGAGLKSGVKSAAATPGEIARPRP